MQDERWPRMAEKGHIPGLEGETPEVPDVDHQCVVALDVLEAVGPCGEVIRYREPRRIRVRRLM
jgi:hypothetical protein